MFRGVAVGLLCAIASTAVAQKVTFQGVISTPSITGTAKAVAIACDHFGHLYVLDAATGYVTKSLIGVPDSNRIIKFTGLSSPQGLAVNDAGDIWVADTGNHRVLKIAAGTNVAVPVGGGFSTPAALAVDRAGNVYVADEEANKIWKVSSLPPTLIGSGFLHPTGVAVDASGNVFVADTWNGRLVEITSSGTQNTILSNLELPSQVAVDAQGNIFVNNYQQAVAEIAAGTLTVTALPVNALSFVGITVDGNGNLYGLSEPNQTFLEVSTENIALKDTYVCLGASTTTSPCASTVALNFYVNAAVSIGSINVLTDGVSGLDFTANGDTSCKSTTYAAGIRCSVNVTFTPRNPGLRKGAVQIVDSTGNLLVSVNLYGRSFGPQMSLALPTSTQMTKTISVSGLSTTPGAVGVDGAGNVYVSDEVCNCIYAVPAKNGSSQMTLKIPNLYTPGRVVVGGDGSLYLPGGGFVTKIASVSQSQKTLLSGLHGGLTALALDGRGNLDVSASAPSDNKVLRLAQDGSSVTLAGAPLISLPTDLVEQEVTQGIDVPVNYSEPLVTNYTYVLQQVSPFGDGTSTFSQYPAVSEPNAIAADPSGRILLSTVNGIIDRNGTLLYAGSGVNSFTRDAAGNLYIALGSASTRGPSIVELPAIQQSVIFASTKSGASSASTVLTVRDTGNLAMTLTGLSVTGTFTLDPGSTTCTSSTSLGKGGSCTIGIVFKPTAVGQATGTLILSAKDLAIPNISLTGTGA